MKECKIIQFEYMATKLDIMGEQIESIPDVRVKEFPEVEKRLNAYLQQGWKITPMSHDMFYLEREK